jgi:hypothetical protein
MPSMTFKNKPSPTLLESFSGWLHDPEFGALGFYCDTRDSINHQLLPQEEETLWVKGNPECVLALLEALDTTIAAENAKLTYRVQRPDDDVDILSDITSKSHVENDETFFEFISSLLAITKEEEVEDPSIIRVIMLTGPTMEMDVLNHHLESITEETQVDVKILNRRRFAPTEPAKGDAEQADAWETMQHVLRTSFTQFGCVAMEVEDQIHNALTGTVF